MKDTTKDGIGHSLEYPNVPEWMRVSEYYGRGFRLARLTRMEEITYLQYDNIKRHADNKKYLNRQTFVVKHYNRDLGRDEIASLLGITPNAVGHIACELRKRGKDIPMIHRGPHSKKISELTNG